MEDPVFLVVFDYFLEDRRMDEFGASVQTIDIIYRGPSFVAGTRFGSLLRSWIGRVGLWHFMAY